MQYVRRDVALVVARCCCHIRHPLAPGTAARLPIGLDMRTATSAAGSGSRAGDPGKVAHSMQDLKVSPRGTSDALFQECLDKIRRQRSDLDHMDFSDHVHGDTEAVTQLKQDELEITRKVFQRLDPTNEVTSDLQHAGHHIDPYWNPFHKTMETKEAVWAEFDDYAKVVSVAESKRARIQIKRSIKRMASVYNPYSPDFKKYHDRKAGEQAPKPFRLPDRYWERTPLQEQLGREKITWRDVDIIQHFIADNGYILPRRTTMLSRKKQAELVQAIKIAQKMSLLPYESKPADYMAMPLMDPLQWMVDRLTDRAAEARDRRSRAMLRVMMERYPDLNYRMFLKHEAARAARGGEPGSPERAAKMAL